MGPRLLFRHVARRDLCRLDLLLLLLLLNPSLLRARLAIGCRLRAILVAKQRARVAAGELALTRLGALLRLGAVAAAAHAFVLARREHHGHKFRARDEGPWNAALAAPFVSAPRERKENDLLALWLRIAAFAAVDVALRRACEVHNYLAARLAVSLFEAPLRVTPADLALVQAALHCRAALQRAAQRARRIRVRKRVR